MVYAKQKVRSLPQEEPATKFTGRELRLFGELSISLGRLHWQNDVGSWDNQVAMLVQESEKLASIVHQVLLREA